MQTLTRRAFIGGLYRVVSGAALFSLVPVRLLRNRSTIPLNEQQTPRPPYWLRVLSQGVSFIPEPLKIDTDSWGKDAIKDRAYAALNIALKQTQRVRSGEIPSSDENMTEVINNGKYGQFLLESLREKYEFTQDFPPLTYKSDPVRARFFCELSRSILHQVMTTVDSAGFTAFSDFDIKLLKSAESYLREAINTFQNAIPIAPQRYRVAITLNLASSYNNLGLTLNFLGDIGGAREMYARALQIKPNDDSVRKNMGSITENASYIKQTIP